MNQKDKVRGLRNPGLVILIFSVCCFTSNLCYSQFSDTTFFVTHDSLGNKVRMTDENFVINRHYSETLQLFEHVGLRFTLGELLVKRANGDTGIVKWDTHYSKYLDTQYMPVYSYNSTAYSNEIISEPFTISQGDSLHYFMMWSIFFPEANQDSSTRIFAQDTSLFSIPDSIAFVVQIVNAATGNIKANIDTILVQSVSSYYDFICHFVEGVQSGAYPKDYHFRYGNFTPGNTYRLRVYPLYFPQLYDSFTERNFLVKYYWTESMIKYFDDNANDLANEAVNSMPLYYPKSASMHNSNLEKTLEMYPRQLTTKNRVLTFTGRVLPTLRNISISIVDVTGKQLMVRHFSITDGQTSLAVEVPIETLASSGIYHCIVKNRTTMLYDFPLSFMK